jgi:hypothetical protein
MKLLAFILVVSSMLAQQVPANRQAGDYIATAYNYDIDSSSYGSYGIGSFTFPISTCQQALQFARSRNLDPFNTNASVLITDSFSPNTETVAFLSQTFSTGFCVLSLAITHPHTSYHLSSGTYGLQEAINDAAASGGGNVVVDTQWRGTTAMITSAAGSSIVSVTDNRTGSTLYTWNGSTYTANTTVTSVGLTQTGNIFTITNTPIIGSGNINIAFASAAQNLFLATPNGSSGAPSLRAIAGADVPTLNQNTTGTAGNLSGTPALPNGTTATTQTNGDNTTKLATDAFVLSNAASGGGLPTPVIYVSSGLSSGAIQTLLTNAVSGNEFWFSGIYAACSLTLTVANVRLRGFGTDGATIQCATPGVPVATVSGSADQVSGITFKHITTTPTCAGGNGTSTCGDGLQIAGGAGRVKVENVHTNFNWNGITLGWTTYSEYSNSVSEFNQNHGVVFVMDATNKNMQWQISRILSEQNLGNGFDMTCPAAFTSVQTPGPYLSGWTTAFGNAGYGYKFSCSAATTSGIADIFMSATFSSQNNKSGYFLDVGPNGGRNTEITGFYSEQAGTYTGTAGFAQASQSATNVGYGVEITNSCDPTSPFTLSGGILWSNSYSGALASCGGTSFSNVDTDNNGAASASAQTEAGVTINATSVSVVGGFHKKSTTQNYGVYVLSGDTPNVTSICDSSITFANCVFSGTQPTNGYQQRLGQMLVITSTGAPSGACNNGSTYSRTDAGNFSTLYACKNAAWAALN